MTSRLADPARSRIVLIGTPAHRRADGRLSDVPAVANNIADLAAVFTDPELGGFDPVHCVATTAGIGLDALGEVLTKAASQAEDLLLIYYAGHGLLDRRFQLHLALADTHPDRLKFTALPYETLREVCLDSGATVKVVILDCCFSGRAFGQPLAGDDQQVLGQLDVAGTYILTSAPANRVALVLPGERHTAFTGRLLNLLREGDPKAGAVLTIGEIYRQLRSRLHAEGLPQPQKLETENADLLGLVRNRRVRSPVVAASRGTPTPAVNPKPAVALPIKSAHERPTRTAGSPEARHPATKATPAAPPLLKDAPPRTTPHRRKKGRTAANAMLVTAVFVAAGTVSAYWGDIEHLWTQPRPTPTTNGITLIPGLPDPCTLITSSIKAMFNLSGGIHNTTYGKVNTPNCTWSTRFPDGNMHPLGAVFVTVSKSSASGTQAPVAGIPTAYVNGPTGYGDCTVAWTTSFGSVSVATATGASGSPSTCSEAEQIASAIAPLAKTARLATSTAIPPGTP